MASVLAKRAMTLHQRTGISLKAAWARVKAHGGKASKKGTKTSHSTSKSGGGGRMKTQGALARISGSKTVGGALTALGAIAVDANSTVAVGRKFLAKEFTAKEALTAEVKEIVFNETGIDMGGNVWDPKGWRWKPLDAYETKGFLPLKNGFVRNWGVRLGTRYGLRVAKNVPLFGRYVRKALAMKNPIRTVG